MTELSKQTEQVEVKEGVVKFNKPFSFEGKEYTEIDLSAIEDLTVDDLEKAEDFLSNTGKITPVPEVSLSYLLYLASKATSTPLEFFKVLPAKEGLKVKRTVQGFLSGQE